VREDAFRDRFPPGVADVLVGALLAALDRSYSAAAARHDELEGFDGQTFGFTAYRLSWFQIEQALAGLDGFQVSRPNNSLRIVAGDFAIHVYRAGSDETADIQNPGFLDGTPTKLSVVSSNSLQLTLFQSEEDVERSLSSVLRPEISFSSECRC
jgi:hypothetical protein